VTLVAHRGLRTRPLRPGIGLLAVVAALAGLSLGSTIVKKSAAPGLSVAIWRLVFGSAIWIVMLRGRRGQLSRRAVRLAAPAAFFFAADLALFFVAVTHTSVANAEFIGSLTPVLVVPLAAVLFHERLHAWSLAWAGAALLGIAVILFNASPQGVSSLGGDLLAFAAMSMWASYLLTARRARALLGTAEFMTTVVVVASLLLLPIAAVSGQLWAVPAGAWKYIVLLAVLSGTLSHGLLAWAQTRVPVSTISIFQVANPALATLWAYLILGETIDGVQAVGMAVVVGALAAFTMSTRRSAPVLVEEEDLGGPSG
jgi:drug/metabolite transporter (DMT)-like permease